jgi:signal transduction histidine kinase
MKEGLFKRQSWKILAETDSRSLGLGLPLARSLARRLGGDLLECGEPGKGAKFLLFLAKKA